MANAITSRTHECPYCSMGADYPTKEQFDAHMKIHKETPPSQKKQVQEECTCSCHNTTEDFNCNWCEEKHQPPQEEEGWREDPNHFDFKTPQDLQKCMKWIDSLLSSQRQKYIEAIEGMKHGHTFEDCPYCSVLDDVLAQLWKTLSVNK